MAQTRFCFTQGGLYDIVASDLSRRTFAPCSLGVCLLKLRLTATLHHQD